MKVSLPVLLSNPKKPTLAALPLCQRNSIPRSRLSLNSGAVSPPSVNTGSSTVVTVLLTVVVVPFTVKLPVIVSSATGPITGLVNVALVIVGPLANTNAPLPVSSDITSASSEDVVAANTLNLFAV